MPPEKTLEGFLADIDRFVELSPLDIERVSKQGTAISKTASQLRNLTKLDIKRRKVLNQLAAEVDCAATRLLQSVLNSKRSGTLRGDWARFAQRDVLRLKDEILALREFLVANAELLRPAFQSIDFRNIDLEHLIKELHEEQAISERTWAMFMCHIAECQPKRKMLRDSNVAQQLARICGWLSDFREAKRVNANVR